MKMIISEKGKSIAAAQGDRASLPAVAVDIASICPRQS